jgi:hypothetical protein
VPDPPRLADLDTEEHWHALRGEARGKGYRYAQQVVEALVDRFGEAAVVDLLRGLRDRELGAVLKHRLGLDLGDVERLAAPPVSSPRQTKPTGESEPRSM